MAIGAILEIAVEFIEPALTCLFGGAGWKVAAVSWMLLLSGSVVLVYYSNQEEKKVATFTELCENKGYQVITDINSKKLCVEQINVD